MKINENLQWVISFPASKDHHWLYLSYFSLWNKSTISRQDYPWFYFSYLLSKNTKQYIRIYMNMWKNHLLYLIYTKINAKSTRKVFLKHDGTWVYSSESTQGALQWIPTWQGLHVFQNSLHLRALDKSILSIGGINLYCRTLPIYLETSGAPMKSGATWWVKRIPLCLELALFSLHLFPHPLQIFHHQVFPS